VSTAQPAGPQGLSIAAPIRVAIAGLGVIGQTVAEFLDAGVPGVELAAIGVRDVGKARQTLAKLRRIPALVAMDELEPYADVVVECVPAELLPRVIGPFLRAGKKALVLSSGALLVNDALLRLADDTGGQIIVPSGALLGLDAVSAAAEGTIRSVTMVTRKPVASLKGAPYLKEHGIEIEDIKEPLRVFAGSPREAAVGFPANLNVWVALSLAGVGPDRTALEIWVDPSLTRNIHDIVVESDSAKVSMHIENIPSSNPKTGRITALSVAVNAAQVRFATESGLNCRPTLRGFVRQPLQQWRSGSLMPSPARTVRGSKISSASIS
jgi:aspartate dehydrogenase